MRLAILLSLSLALNADASSLCVTVSGAGAKTGADWNNALDQTFTPVRGNVYYVAAGTYSGKTFSTAASGTTTIEIRGVTSGDHGTDTGWNAGTMLGQALFQGTSFVSTPYWIFNGQTRGASWTNGYTLKFWNPNNLTAYAFQQNSGANHLRWDYVEFQGTTTNNTTGDPSLNHNTDFCIGGADTYSDWYLGHSYLHDSGNSTIQANNASTSDGLTIEYCYFRKNHCNRNNEHDETLAITWNDMTNRFNIYCDFMSTACIANPSGGSPVMHDWLIYNNVFFWDSDFQHDTGVYFGNGVTGFPNDTFSGLFLCCNNTVAGITNDNDSTSGPWQAGFEAPSGTQTNIRTNNIWYNCSLVSNFGGTSAGRNSYFGPNCDNSNDTSPTKVYVSSLPQIFVDYLNCNFNLKTNNANGTTNGISVAQFGITQDANGTAFASPPYRGAFQYSGGGSTTNVFFVSRATGSTSNSGDTPAAPWPQIGFAMSQIAASNTVIVMDGNYTNVIITKQYTSLISSNKGGAIITNAVGHGILGNDGISGITVKGFQVLTSGLDGIKIAGTNCVISDNHIVGAGDQGISGHESTGIPVSDNLVTRNLVEWGGSTNGVSLDHDQGIYFGGRHNTIIGNVSRFNAAYGIQLYPEDGQSNQLNTVAFNLVYSNNMANIFGGGIVVYANGNSNVLATNFVYGNTIYEPASSDGCIKIARGYAGITNNLMQGNILIEAAGAGEVISNGYNVATATISPAGLNNVVTNNLHWANTSQGRFWLSGVNGAALSTVYYPTDFFGNSISSVSDAGAFQYSPIYANDTRNLSGIGADYWGTPVGKFTLKPGGGLVKAGASISFK